MRNLRDSARPDCLAVFPTPLGWMALVGCGRVLKRLTFGHASREAALRALGLGSTQDVRRTDWNPLLVRRLRAYASGKPQCLRDVPVDLGPLTPFQHRVIACCRSIPRGKTLSYGEIAAKAGSPNAARAVGNCMATNPIPLVIPCHRVVGSGGRLLGYSGPGGLAMKRRLLELEGASDVTV